MIADIKASVSLESVLAQAGVDIKRNKIRCISHKPDNNPSAHIYRDKKGSERIHCFVCNKSWDVVDTLQEIYGFSTGDAIEYLANKFGIKHGKVNSVMIQKRNERRELVEAFRSWEKDLRDKLALLLRTARKMLGEPMSEEEIHRWSELINYLPYAEYVHDILCDRDDEMKFELYKEVLKNAAA